jgi:hypothetical protein
MLRRVTVSHMLQFHTPRSRSFTTHQIFNKAARMLLHDQYQLVSELMKLSHTVALTC